MNNIIIIQAREGSTRLPNKVLIKLQNKTILEHIYNRCKKSKANKVVIATTQNSKNIIKLCKEKSMNYFIGNEDNVLQRFYQCALKEKSDNIIRITSDCPIVDYKIINKLIKKHVKENNDFTTNAFLRQETFPEGFDCSIIKFNILENLYFFVKDIKHQEHVVTYIMENPNKYKIGILISNINNMPDIRLTIDYKEDAELINILYYNLYNKNKYFGLKEILKFFKKNAILKHINNHYIRDEKYYKE